MDENVLKATHSGELPIGDMLLPCAVLEDGTRVLSEREVTKSLGGKRGGSHWKRKKQNPDGAYLPVYLSAKNIIPFIDNDLAMALNEPIVYIPKSGGRAYGLRAELLPRICEVWLRAREAGVLKGPQQQLAVMAETLIRGLARIGIIALIDEVTGYQEGRDRDELSRLLAIYLSEERLKWAKMFPDEFYRQIYRLKKWPYPGGGGGKTPYVGRLTNELVYDRLPPGVLDELRNRNPVDPAKKRRHWCHHQFLSADIGQPDLRDHLLQLIALLRASANWDIFKRLFSRAFPKPGTQQELFDDVF